MIFPQKRQTNQSGIALLTSLLLMLLIFSLAAGFMFLVTSGQQMTGLSNGQTRAFYGAEAGMEKLTADLGTLFDNTYSPSAAQLTAIPQNPPVLTGLTFLATDGTSGYKLDYPKDINGKPLATNQTIKTGAFNGMVGLVTPYTLTVTARTESGNEVMLRRTTQTVAIPAFQFGVFCDTDCAFHAGPNFNFGGRVHTNQNLWLAQGDNATLTMSDKVTAFGEVVRTNLTNGQPLSGGWSGTVSIATGSGLPQRNLAPNEGSITDGNTVPPLNLNPNWPSISQTSYNSNLINHRTGVLQKLQLPIEIVSGGKATPIDILRRPIQADAGSPDVLGERYFAQASMKILLSDQANDIMQLPCVDATTPPIDLSTLAVDTLPADVLVEGPLGYPTVLPAWYTTTNPNPAAVPLATSLATVKTAGAAGTANAAPAVGYATGAGYWMPKFEPLMRGFLKIEIQIGYQSPCGKWQDVTQEILKLGVAGRNQNPGLVISNATKYPNVPPLPAAESFTVPSTCPDANPNAVIRLQHIRDNPSNAAVAGVGICGVDTTKNPAVPTTLSTDYWPNVLFDTREGTLRDACPNSSSPCTFNQVMAGGVIHYVELDVKNLARWLTGSIGTKGPGALDPQNAPYNFVVYFSDRRGNYVALSGNSPAWPPLSPTKNETGEYGFSDFVNSSSAANGCPNGVLDTGEDVSASGTYYNYGQLLTPTNVAFGVTNRLFGDSIANALAVNPKCATPSTPWPGYMIKNAQEARMNPPLFFRRALKLVNGSDINTPMSALPCPGGGVCGLTIASENPVYVQGDYNANTGASGFTGAHVATSILADAVTLLSNSWNDLNSFATPYDPNGRDAKTTWYRTAVLAGKALPYPWITGTNADTGSDGGVHNFLRYLENWSGTNNAQDTNPTINYRGSLVSMFYNRQAIGTFKCCNTVYSPPGRGYNFDTEFLQPSLLPPRTPAFRDVNTTGFTQLIYPEQK
jgi:hypothetical protein